MGCVHSTSRSTSGSFNRSDESPNRENLQSILIETQTLIATIKYSKLQKHNFNAIQPLALQLTKTLQKRLRGDETEPPAYYREMLNDLQRAFQQTLDYEKAMPV